MYELPSKVGRNIFFTLLLLHSTITNTCCVCTAKEIDASCSTVPICLPSRSVRPTGVWYDSLPSSVSFIRNYRKKKEEKTGAHPDLIPEESWDAAIAHIWALKLFYCFSLFFKAFLDKRLAIPLLPFSKSIKQVPLCLGIHPFMYWIHTG